MSDESKRPLQVGDVVTMKQKYADAVLRGVVVQTDASLLVRVRWGEDTWTGWWQPAALRRIDTDRQDSDRCVKNTTPPEGGPVGS